MIPSLTFLFLSPVFSFTSFVLVKSWKKNSDLTHFPYGAPPGGRPSPQLPRAGMMHLHGPRRLSSHPQCDCSLSPKASVPACPNTTLASRQSQISPALSGLGISSTQDISTSPVRTLLTEGLKLNLHVVTKCVINKVTAMHNFKRSSNFKRASPHWTPSPGGRCELSS